MAIGSLPSLTETAYREIQELIYTANLRLDAKEFKAWLDLCAPDFRYTVRAFSPEIRKEMAWLDLDLDGMETLVKHLPRHNTDQSTFTRHTTVYTVSPCDDGSAAVTSSVTIYRTALDGGETKLFAIGRYHDIVTRTEGGWRFRAREVRLETRSLGIGTHYPL